VGHPLEHVRQCTVQLTSKRVAGTGFFVERNIVLTCAHVVHSRTEPVIVGWRGRQVRGTVLDRIPDLKKSGKAYPFPDLAFIGLDEVIDHPVADLQTLLLKRGNNRGLSVLALTFNREAPNPQGGPDPVRLAVQGPSDSWVKATPQSGVIPGMSGAPVVDESTGRVCGILKYSVASQNAVWFIDTEDIERYVDRYRNVLDAYEPLRVKLFRPEPGEPLHTMLVAQRAAAEKLPYQVVKGDVPLSTVYVEQRAEAWRAEQTRARPGRPAPAAEPSVIQAVEMLQRHRNALVVSGPGGGKSTLLQHLVAESAQWWLRPGQPERGEVPAFGPAVAVRCAASRLIAGRAWYQTIADAVNAELRGHLTLPVRPEMFERPPSPGVDWLVLIDGLDEIIQSERRGDLIGILAGHIARYGGQARFVVSSRALAETEFGGLRAQVARVDRSRRLGEYNLRPFDRPAVESFAHRWYELRDPTRAAERATGFLDEVDRRRLMPLVAIPLLCTIAADVYQHNPDAQLPSGRTALYRKFVEGLLFGRRVEPAARHRVREELAAIDRRSEEFGETFFDRRLECLTYLADLRMSRDRQPSVELTRGWLASEGIAPPPGVTDDHIREILLSTGLVVNHSDGMQFTHQSIAEYLSTGGDVKQFNWDVWLRSVSEVGVSSSRMFELGRWADAGNDPMVVVNRLAEPGPDHEYPLLGQLADVVSDGAAASAAATAATLGAVQDVQVHSPAGMRAVNKAARALVQRAPDPSPLIHLINNPHTPEGKRIEVASVVLAEGDADGRQWAARVLEQLAYDGGRTAELRLPALRALAEAGLPIQRRNALMHLRSLVQTAADPAVRHEAAELLVTLGEPGEVLVALAGRLAQGDRDPGDEMATVYSLSTVQSQIYDWIDRLGAEPDPEPYRGGGQVAHLPWSVPRAEPRGPFPGAASTVATLAGLLAGHIAPEQVGAAVTTVMRERSGPWFLRSSTAKAFPRPELVQFAAEQLVNDPSIAPTVRVVTGYTMVRPVNRVAAGAMLRDIVGNERADLRARLCALNMLALREGGSGRRWLTTVARDPLMPPALRVEAAAALGRSPDRAEALILLAELVTDGGLSRLWRRRARVVRLVIRAGPAIRRVRERAARAGARLLRREV
jgi:trypsin-like peptidase